MMTSPRRWQDWGVLLLGVVLMISPIFFATALGAAEAWAAYALGALITVIGAASLAIPAFKVGGAIQIALAVVTFFSPWLLGFAAVTGMVWVAIAVAVGLLLLIGAELAMGEGRQLPQAG